ncbi:DUF4132 domain-containing protein [Chitinilyticum aquatile]|uniref:DUF4132 domain-containing protein n=1 Tax=Chitinilyticum aquatile TaxID=362520 RepID=UPI0004033189|nr:DUF4132 domain-containing protein [Chitinilyticum aquatile]
MITPIAYPFLHAHWPQVAELTASVLDLDRRFADYRAAHPELRAEFRLWADVLDQLIELEYDDETHRALRCAWWRAVEDCLGQDGTRQWLWSVVSGFCALRANHPAFANAGDSSHGYEETRLDRMGVLLEMQQRLSRNLLSTPELYDYPATPDLFEQLFACTLAGLPTNRMGYYDETPPNSSDNRLALFRQVVSGVLHFDDNGIWLPQGGGIGLPVQPGRSLHAIEHQRRLLIDGVRANGAEVGAISTFCRQWPDSAPYELLSWQMDDWPPAMLPLRETLFELLLLDPQTRSLHWLSDEIEPELSTRICGYRAYLHVLRQLGTALHDATLGSEELQNLLAPFARNNLLDPGWTRDQAEEASAIAELASYPPRVLHLLLEKAGWSGDGAQRALLPALGKAQLLDISRRCRELMIDAPADEPRGDVAVLRSTLQALPSEDWALLGNAMLSKELAGLTAALRGDDSTAIEKSALKKHAHLAIMSLGLLPLPAEQQEVLCQQRYLQLNELHQLASQYGTERCANQREAVQIGLANLAANAGFSSLGALEWAMESRQGEALQPFFAPQAIGDYHAHIRLAGDDSGIVIVNAKGKRLASTPAALKKDPDWLALKDAWDTLKEQRRRFRAVLDDHLVRQTRFSGEQLDAARAHPVLYDLISKLVWVYDAGHCGLYQLGQLSGLDDFHDIEGSLRLAHPLDWMSNGTLAAWQQHAVALQLLQPIQQIFRALYVPTPAELESGTVSQRYAHRWVKTRIAAGIFRQRGWRPSGYSGNAEHHRPLGEGYSAHIDFDFHAHFFTEVDTLQTTGVTFRRDSQDVPLASVPPILFSEAMRDLDLMIARSLVNDTGEFTSGETLAARHALLQALAPALGGERLRLDERHAHVTGRLANYRVNLASAHIHIEPGAYLCVIPDWSQAQGKLRLPFEDSDIRTAEIISKIVMLLDDDRIGDESILRQIRQYAAAAIG